MIKAIKVDPWKMFVASCLDAPDVELDAPDVELEPDTR